MAKKRKTRKPREGISKQEKAYCEAYAENGGNGAEAVAKAMPHTRKWSPQSRAVRSSKLQAKAKIRERIAEFTAIMRQKANEDFAMSAEEIVYRLTLMGRANLAHYMKIDGDGQPTIAFKDATEAQMYALNECSVDDIETKRGKGKRTKIKLTDRISAMKLLGMQHGMFKQIDVNLKGTGPIQIVMSSAEAAV